MRFKSRRALAIAALASGLILAGVRAQSCVINVPHVTGTWVVLPYQMPINPISANLLPTGKVLIVAGSENDASNNSKGAESYRAAIWDPTGTSESSIVVQHLNYDVFCSGTASLPDGRSLIVGGTSVYTSTSFTGENRASIFNPRSQLFVQSQNMANGRWYASAITLGDGRIMAMSGLTLTGGTSTTIEIYDLRNAGAGWNAPTGVPFTPALYPRIFLLPNGKVFYTGQGKDISNANSWIFDPVGATWTVSAPTTRTRLAGSSVMLPLLPPSYTPRVMNFGGGSPATNTTELIDLFASNPVWTPGPNMSTGRIQMNAVLLPNGNVLAEGGSVNYESPDTPGKTADLYDSSSNTMHSGGTAAYSRLYHSTALLLPDARVVSMGSNPGARGSYEPAIEVYTPPYLFDAGDRLITTKRPNITGVSSALVGYNSLLSVSYTSTSAISSAVLMRIGSDTHAFDMEQRMIGLCGPTPQQPNCSGANGILNLTTPPDGDIAPPGYYMLFLLDSAGVPSTARFIQLTPYSTSAPSGTIVSPASDVSIAAGATVNFTTSSAAAKYSWVFPGGWPATSTAQNPGSVTFPTPGTYRASLTVIDSSGNSDPNPPTRRITVKPVSPDFSITVGPSAQQVIPGGAAEFTGTVTPLGGFAGSVSLSVGSESGFPSGISSGGFSPASITGSGSSVLTMDTTTSTIPWALSLTITGTSGTLTHTASTTLLVNLAPPATITATPGDRQVSLSWPGSVGATAYHVKRASVSHGPYVGIACPTGTSYVDTGLTDGTAYYYVISAAFSGNPNAGGESADSGQVSAIPQGPPPSPPTSLTATAINVGTISLKWVQSTSAGVTRNSVYRRTSSTSYSSTPLATISATTSYQDSSVSSGTTYCYVVTATSSSGQSGDSIESCTTAK